MHFVIFPVDGMRHPVQELFECLRDAGHAADTIHGDREQPQREAALAAFKAGRTLLLVSVERCPRHASQSHFAHSGHARSPEC